MAEVQKTTLSGELSQRFIEFVIMHAQNAALFLGQIPNPKSGEPEVNLDLARMFIDQLAMIQEKTRGNLNHGELIDEHSGQIEVHFGFAALWIRNLAKKQRGVLRMHDDKFNEALRKLAA